MQVSGPAPGEAKNIYAGAAIIAEAVRGEHPSRRVIKKLATIGALPVAVAQAGASVGYLPGLATRRIADLHPGQAKTDAPDAAIIAEAARSIPHTLLTQIHPALERALGPHLDHSAVADLPPGIRLPLR